MSKQDVVDYVMHTPYNTNKAVLESILDSIEGGGDVPQYDGDYNTITITNNLERTVELLGVFVVDGEVKTFISLEPGTTTLGIISDNLYTIENIRDIVVSQCYVTSLANTNRQMIYDINETTSVTFRSEK